MNAKGTRQSNEITMSHPLFILIPMTTKTRPTDKATQPQLLLVSNSSTTATGSWVLDEETRETGRRGLAKARAALQATRPAYLDAAA